MGSNELSIEAVKPSVGSMERPAPKPADVPAQLRIYPIEKPDPPRKTDGGDGAHDSFQKAADPAASALGIVNRVIRFDIDETSDRIIVRIIDRETDEVIREIPSEELRRAAQRFDEYVGRVFDTEG